MFAHLKKAERLTWVKLKKKVEQKKIQRRNEVWLRGAMNVPNGRVCGKHVGGWARYIMWFSQGQADPAHPTSVP